MKTQLELRLLKLVYNRSLLWLPGVLKQNFWNVNRIFPAGSLKLNMLNVPVKPINGFKVKAAYTHKKF